MPAPAAAVTLGMKAVTHPVPASPIRIPCSHHAEVVPPEARRVPGDTYGGSDPTTRFSPEGGQDNLGSLHLPPGQSPRPHPRLENPSITPSQSQLLGRCSHGHQYTH